MDNDLDIAGARAVLFDVVREGNSRRDTGRSVDDLVAAFDEIVSVLGLDGGAQGAEDSTASERVAATFGIPGGSIDDLLDLRALARVDKNWALSDAIRDALAGIDIIIEDTPDGARWHRR